MKERLEVCLGETASSVGALIYVREGRREYSSFAYDAAWLASAGHFSISPDLPELDGYQPSRNKEGDSPFPLAVADTAPDTWGRQVIIRDHAKRKKRGEDLPPLSEVDFLLAVDDVHRVGALRLRKPGGPFERASRPGVRTTPPLVDLRKLYDASRAVEEGQETEEDLRYLLGRGTSLGGLRPKCSALDDDGSLAIGKFPSTGDTRDVTRAEVLAMRLARAAGIDAADARIVEIEGVAVALIKRFDRLGTARIPYMSGASLLQSARHEERAYTEVADMLRAVGHAPIDDARQLWRRLVFNLLITNVDDHLHNLGFLHVENGLWRMAPAFDLNPFPDKRRESKTWLSEATGPIVDVEMLLSEAPAFSLTLRDARAVLREVSAAVAKWREVARSGEVGMRPRDLDDVEAAFEHEQQRAAVQAGGAR